MNRSAKNIHVVAFDVPFPPDYGGVIDIYYKIKALAEAGVNVHLHCYTYGRPEHSELESICASVRYYRRKVFKNPIYSKKPYIVASRNSGALIEDLLQDDYPILFEGLHCTYYLSDKRLADRFKIVRTHNIEHEYYAHLELVESNLFKKYFFRVEADRLKRYERILRHAQLIAAISPKDEAYFEKKYGNTILVPPFHRNEEMETSPGKGEFILYHGNLAVGENNEAALFLVNEVFPTLSMPCLVAGNGASSELRDKVAELKHVRLVEHVTTSEIEDLIRRAHINVLPTHQSTGIKLKLVNALYMGRFCVVNDAMVDKTGLEPLCVRANTSEQYIQQLERLWQVEFDLFETDRRSELLFEKFNNHQSALKILEAVEESEPSMVE
ncbi:MAG: glycosyltransferase [Flavobacteriales bacterium]|nr:glycosyltransferase [Flavobacteriales bacterium]